jgi:hypothetical protein
MHRLDGAELVKAHAPAPAEEIRDRPGIGLPGIGIADIGGEEFHKAAGRPVAGGGDLHRQKGTGPVDDNEVFCHGFSVSHLQEK